MAWIHSFTHFQQAQPHNTHTPPMERNLSDQLLLAARGEGGGGNICPLIGCRPQAIYINAKITSLNNVKLSNIKAKAPLRSVTTTINFSFLLPSISWGFCRLKKGGNGPLFLLFGLHVEEGEEVGSIDWVLFEQVA